LVIKDAGRYRRKQSIWRCVCTCGCEKNIRACDLKSGRTKSCGCYMKEMASQRAKGKSKSEEQKKKQAETMTGRKLSEERIDQITNQMKELYAKREHPFQKMNFIGENNPSYKHGFSGTKAFNNAKSAKRRGLKLNQTPPEADMEEINIIYKICSDMNRRAGRVLFHVDHIIPLSKNGLHHQDNLQILYARDNLSKASKILYEGEGYGKRIKD